MVNRINFVGLDDLYGAKKMFYSLLMCIKVNTYCYPPKDIRRLLFKWINIAQAFRCKAAPTA